MSANLQVMLYKEALKSPMNKKVAAIIVKNGKVVAKAHNKYNMKNVKNISIYKFSTHAEEACIKKSKCISGSKIYIMRVDNTGNVVPIVPCAKCIKLIEKYNIQWYAFA